jgi:hypothetical protein
MGCITNGKKNIWQSKNDNGYSPSCLFIISMTSAALSLAGD